MQDAIDAGLDIRGALQQAWANVTSWLEGIIASFPNVVAAALVLLLFWILARGVRGVARRVLERMSAAPDVARLLSSLTFLIVMAAGLFVSLGVLGLDRTVTSLLAGVGILGLALGIAFQAVAESFIAGVFLAFRRRFNRGDIIRTNDYTGTVEGIEMRATVLRTFEGQMVIIPNSEIFKKPLVNFSDLGYRRVDVPVGVAYGSDLARARRVAIEAVSAIEARDASRDVEVFYEAFGDSAIEFQLRFWIPFRRQTDYLGARSEAVMRIKAAFDANDITIPFPIRTLDFSKVGGTELRDAWPAER